MLGEGQARGQRNGRELVLELSAPFTHMVCVRNWAWAGGPGAQRLLPTLRYQEPGCCGCLTGDKL